MSKGEDPAEHPSAKGAGAAVVARCEAARARGETNAQLWERVVREALTGRSRKAAGEVLGVHERTVQRWREWLDDHGGAPVGAWEHGARGVGARGGTSPATVRAVKHSPDRESGASAPDHVCDARLLPGECLRCLDLPRPYVPIDSWAGRQRVDVEIVGATPKRLRIRFLADNRKGKRGDVRLVSRDVVVWPPSAGAPSSPDAAAAHVGGIRREPTESENR